MDWISKELRAPLRTEGPENCVWIFEEPIKGHKYVLASDVSRGDAKDFSTMAIIDMASGETAAEYRGKIFPDQLADLIDRYGRLYNNAIVIVEANTFGNHTLTDLKKKNYTNIFYRTAPAHSIENYYATAKDKWGFDTQTNTRMEALAKLEDTMRCHIIHPRSSRYYEELQSFVYVDKKSENGDQKQRPQAKKGKNDDLVMTYALACWLIRVHFENYRLSFKGGNVTSETKPLFMYMSKDNRKYVNPATGQLPFSPRLAVSRDNMYAPTHVEMDPTKLGWLI
jgi:hypothetical protein